jgi:hypothetical protein
MPGARLTKQANGSYALPVVEVFPRPADVVVGKVRYPRGIWEAGTAWSDAQLAKQGLARIDDVTVVAAGKVRLDTFTDVYEADRVKRTYDLGDLAPELPRRTLLGRVSLKRREIIEAGISIPYGGSTYVLETDQTSRESVSGVVAAIGAGAPLPLNSDGTPNGSGTGTHISWRMRDNTDLLLSAAEFVSTLAVPLLNHVNGAHLASRAHKAAIAALTTWAEVEAYDLNTGWPPVADPVVWL